MLIRKLFSPARPIEQIKDPKLIDKKYRYWRIRILYAMFFGYILFYFSRYSFTHAKPLIMNEFGYDKWQLGMIETTFAVVYGISKFLNGAIADRSNPRYVMGMGLILTGVFNILFGFSSSFILFVTFWGLNAWFQGYGWPPCARLLMHWYSKSERGRWWGIWNVSHNIGAALIPIIIIWLAQGYNWRIAMYFPALICLLGGLFLINRLRDTPQSLGLPPVQQYRKDQIELAGMTKKEEVELPLRKILFDHVLKNKYMWLLGLVSCFVYMARNAVSNWGLLFLLETKGHIAKGGLIDSISFASFEVGGLVGSLAAGWISDCVFKGFRWQTNISFSFGMVISFACFWYFRDGFIANSFWFFACGFFLFGPQMLLGMCAAELAHKKAAATATGFIGFFSYAGAAIVGAPLGGIIDRFGWNAFFIVAVASSTLALLLYIPVCFKEHKEFKAKCLLKNI